MRLAWTAVCLIVLLCLSPGGCGGGDQPVGKCAPPDADKVTLCGRVFDLADTSPLGTGLTGAPVADRRVALHDPTSLLLDPGAPAIAGFESLEIDDSGWYHAVNVPVPEATRGIVVSVDDAEPDAGVYHRTAVRTTVARGNIHWLHAFSTTEETDAAWGAPPGAATFGTRGVLAPIFVDMYARDPTPSEADPFHGKPVRGVTAVQEGGVPLDPTVSDYYFSDADPLLHLQLDLTGFHTTTGPSGTALVTGAVRSLSGAGHAGCTWETVSGTPVDGVILVQLVGGECH